MPTRPVYASEESILSHLRSVKLHPNVTLESLSVSASNEVDGLLGARYRTPFSLNTVDPSEATTAFWLQNVTSQLAAGRYLLATSASGSQEAVNAYGRYLVDNAIGLINMVLKGQTDLEGLDPAQDHTGGQLTGATIINGDAFSQVDYFYENFEPNGFAPGRYVPESKGTWPT